MKDERLADTFVQRIAKDWRKADLIPENFALCVFAEKLTREPNAMSSADIADLRVHGFTDQAIHDAVQVIGYFNYINRVADALGVEQEDGIRHWEQ